MKGKNLTELQPRKCIKCFAHDVFRGEFCNECFKELLDQLHPDEEFELPELDDIQPIY